MSAYFIISEDSGFGRPSQAFCDGIRQQYGLTMPVLINDQGQLDAAGLRARHTHFVLEQGGGIVFRDQFNDSRFIAEIEQLLGQ